MREVFPDENTALSGSLSFSREVTSKSLSSAWDEQGSSTSALVTFWGWIILCCGGCPLNCRMFRTLPGLHPQDVSSIPSFPSPLIVTIKIPTDIAKYPWGQKSLLVENHWPRVVPKR